MTDEIEKEFYCNIVSKCEILTFDNFIKKIKERKTVDNIFFYRQKYVQDDLFAPELQSSCFCEKFFNPDINFFQCKDCKDFIHNNCFLKSDSKRCPRCGNALEITQKDKPIINSFQDQKTSLLQNKRLREEEFPQNNVQRSLVMEASNEDSKKESEDSKFKFSNLNDEKKRYLTSLIDRLTKTSTMINYNCTPEDKLRKNFRDQFCYSLLYGIEEIKEGLVDIEKVKNPQLNQAIQQETTIIKFCNSISVAIETAMWLQNGEQASKAYKKKFQTLYYNIMDNRNSELRFSILNSEISPSELVKMSSEELAPSSLKSRRTEQQNKYFKEQVLMKGEAKIIAKTHKGESILVVDKGENTMEVQENINNNLIINKVTKDDEKKQDDNLSDKASWVYESDGDKKQPSNNNEKNNKPGQNNSHRAENMINQNVNLNDSLNVSRENSTQNNFNLQLKENSDPKYKHLTREQKEFMIMLDEFTVVR